MCFDGFTKEHYGEYVVYLNIETKSSYIEIIFDELCNYIGADNREASFTKASLGVDYKGDFKYYKVSATDRPLSTYITLAPRDINISIPMENVIFSGVLLPSCASDFKENKIYIAKTGYSDSICICWKKDVNLCRLSLVYDDDINCYNIADMTAFCSIEDVYNVISVVMKKWNSMLFLIIKNKELVTMFVSNQKILKLKVYYFSCEGRL